MNSRRKAPMPQCSFHIHKGPSFSGKTTGNAGNVAENMKLSSYLNTDKDTPKEVQPIAPRNISPRSIVENETPPAIASNACDNSTASRDISPMRKSITPKAKTVVRRSNSFDDTFCYISSTDPTKAATISSPIRAGKRKERMLRCASLPTKMKKNVTFDGKYDKIHEIERITDLPDEVILDLWWSTEDYQNIKREYEAIIYLLDQNMNIDEQHDSARGLHSRTELGAWELYEKQRNARNAVLRQQDIHRKQKIKGTNNTNASTDVGMSIDVVIAKAYMDETLHLRDDAIQWAKKDYEIAMDVHVTTTSSSDTESLEESISDLSILINDKEDSAPVAVEKPQANDRTIQPLRRTRSDNCFVDSMTINKKDICQKYAPSRSKSTQQSASKLSDHINNTSDSVLFKRTEQLASVFEESLLIMSDDEEDEDEEDGDGKMQSDDDARSTETIPKPTNQKDHVATRVRFASKTQKIKRIKVKDIETDTKKRWYSKAELIEIASDVNNMVETIEKDGECLDSDFVPEKRNGETRRGLEKSTEMGAKKLYDRRRHAWNVVLATQSKHRQNQNSQDEENINAGTMSIAEAYIAATKEAQQEAMKFGKQDAKEARKYRIKRRSTTPDPNSKDKGSADHIDRSTSGRRSQASGKDDQEEGKSATSNIKERSISPPFERSIVSGDDSIHSLLNTHTDSTDDCYDCSSRSILNLDSTDDCNEYSVRSILNLDTDSVLSADSVSTSEANCADLIDGICSTELRLSESHAPNRRFVQAATTSLNRHIKMLEAKQQSSTIFGPLRDGKSIMTKSKKFHNNPYDTSSTRDDSTTNDGSEGNDTTDSIREESLQTRLAPVQEALKMDVVSSISKNAAFQKVLNEAVLPSTGTMSLADSTSDSFVWFQVKAADIKEMSLEDGSVVYVLRNAIKCDNHPHRS